MRYCDVLIIGAGPAGLSCAIYTARAKLGTIVIEGEALGGQTTNIDLIENYAGYPDGISGSELGSRMAVQAANCGAELIFDQVVEINPDAHAKMIKTRNGETYKGKALVVCSGCKPLKLNIPGEAQFTGRGITYCAVCDGGRFRDKTGIVIGAGDSGISASLYLERFASAIKIIELQPKPTASRTLLDRVYRSSKCKIICNTKVASIDGDTSVRGVSAVNCANGEKIFIDGSEILVHIGIAANTAFLKGSVPLDNMGRIIVNKFMETPVQGVFAAGDARSDSLCQVGCAVGDGVVAGLSAQKYVTQL